MKTISFLRKHFKCVNKFNGKPYGMLSGYELEGLIGFEHLDTSVMLIEEDYAPKEFSVRNAFLDYADIGWDYAERDDSDMRNATVREQVLKIAKALECLGKT